MFGKRFITLNFEANSIRGVVLRRGRVERWGRVPLSLGLVKEALILQPRAVGQAIELLLKSMGVPKKKCIVSLSGLRSMHRVVTLPRMSPVLLFEAIQRAAKREMPVPLEELYLSWRSIGIKGNEQEFFIVGVPRDLVDAEVQTLVGGGIKPFIVYLKPLALARLINRRDALIIDLEVDSFSIILVANGIPAIMRTTIPRREGVTLEDNIRRLTEEILRTIGFYNQGHPENPLSQATPVFLTGELSDDVTIVELMRHGIEYPLSPLIPPVKCPHDMPVASYAVNIGLALTKMPKSLHVEGCRDIALNVLPDRYKARGWPIGPILFSLAVMIAIIGLFPMYQMKTESNAEITRLNSELNRVTAEFRQARPTIIKEKALKEDIDKAMAAAKTLEQEHQTILIKRGRMANIFQLVTALLPSGVRLTSVIMTSDQIILEGEAENPSEAVSYAKAFEREGSFTKVSITKLSETSFSMTVSK